jgi:type II secretory ATPase GspE/PulE/Tfp pilus assembly ATPase PilB-like protein
MTRRLFVFLILAVFAAILALQAGEALAQESGNWETLPLPEKDWRGPGFYLSWVKVMAYWLVFLLWVKTTDWVNRDLQEHRVFNYLHWNPILFGAFLGTMILLWLLPIPWFTVGISLLLLAHAVPLTVYIVRRNAKLDPALRVLTPDHLRYVLSQVLGKVGIKISAERVDPNEIGPPVKLLARGGPSPQDEMGRLFAAKQTAGMRHIREIFAQGLTSRATTILLDYLEDNVEVRYLIDGVWLPQDPLQNKTAKPALETLKTLCGLDLKDQPQRGEGLFTAKYNNISYASKFICQTTQAGQRATIEFEEKRARFENLEALGMRAKVREQLEELMDRKTGFFLFSALPANGLRTTMTVTLRNADRLMREFVSVEEENNLHEAVENIPVTTYNASAGETPMTVLPKLLRTDPNVVIVRDLVNAETVRFLCREAAPHKLVVGNIRAKDGAESLLRVLAMKVQPAEFAKVVIGVIHQRLIRKLCPDCKQAYDPEPETLRQMGIPEGRIAAFFRPPEPPPPGEKKRKKDLCSTCGGTGYMGRTAIFEVLAAGDMVRNVLVSAPKLDAVRSAARKDGMRLVLEDGLLLVAKGITSLPELMRVLK